MKMGSTITTPPAPPRCPELTATAAMWESAMVSTADEADRVWAELEADPENPALRAAVDRIAGGQTRNRNAFTLSNVALEIVEDACAAQDALEQFRAIFAMRREGDDDATIRQATGAVLAACTVLAAEIDRVRAACLAD